MTPSFFSILFRMKKYGIIIKAVTDSQAVFPWIFRGGEDMNINHEKIVGITQTDSFLAVENLKEAQKLPGIHPLNLDYFGAEQCRNGYAFGPFVRTSFLLHIVKSGRGKLSRDDMTWPVREGQAFLIRPGEVTVYQADEVDPWYYMWIGFHGLLAEEMAGRAGFSEDNPVITCRNISRVTGVMDQLLECREMTYVNELMQMGYLYHVMGLLTAGSDRSVIPKNDTLEAPNTEKVYVREAMNLLSDPQNPQIKVTDVARTIGISRGYLSSLFKRELMISPQEFQIRFRLEKALYFLRNTDLSVSAIAEELGYMDVLSFSKSFHKHLGMSPSAYRAHPDLLSVGSVSDN